MLRLAARQQLRSTMGRRFQSSVLEQVAYKPDAAKAKAFLEHEEAVFHHSKGTSELWKKITYFLAFPAIFAAGVNTYIIEAEHAKHREHQKHMTDEEWPLDYPYQNIRKKNFFWGDGDKTLFWNSDCNRHVTTD